MDREMGERRSPRGVPRLPFGLLAVLAVSVLAWAALPVGAAGGGPRPFADTQGPVITSIGLLVPFAPDALGNFNVTATAQDMQSIVVAADFFVDTPGDDSRNPFMMLPLDKRWDSLNETVQWSGPFDFLTSGLGFGEHTLWVHARDAAGNWGNFTNATFVFYNANTTGPFTTAVAVTPTDVSAGTLVTLDASLQDWFLHPIQGAEFFIDVPGPDGTGTVMNTSTGSQWGTPSVAVTWSGNLALAPGPHALLVHGRNDRQVWGAPASAALTSWAPAFTLSLLADRDTAKPGDLVTYAISFQNRGNAIASSVSLDATLPATLVYSGDTAPPGTTRTNTHFAFADQPTQAAVNFDLTAMVVPTATDGLPLDASAALHFTNVVGWNFPAKFASSTGSVIAPELALSVSAPAIASAGDAVTLLVRLDNTGIRAIPTVDVRLTVPAWVEFQSDNSLMAGGHATGPWSWRFTDVPSLRQFTIQARLSTAAADGSAVRVIAHATYVSRVGIASDVGTEASIAISRPIILAPTIEIGNPSVDLGGRTVLSVQFANDGSAAAQSVHLAVALPPSLSRVGGDVPSSSNGGALAWDFTSIVPGRYIVTLLVEGVSAGRADILVDLTYASPSGVPLARFTAMASLTVVAPLPPTTVATATVAASALTVALFVATERGKTAFLFLFIPLYTRLRHEKVLDHETRGMIRGYIVANPGDHYNAIKEALELPNGTLAYHIQVLQKESIVKSVKDGKFRRFYPFEMRMPEGGQPTKIQRVILDLIRANPGITPRDAAGLLGLGSSTVSYHLEKLEEIGRIESRREGISKRLYVKDDSPA